MAITACTAIACLGVTENGTIASSASSAIQDAWTIGGDATNAAQTAITWSLGTTGTAISINVVASQRLVLAGSATTLDLTGVVALLATKTIAKARGFIIKNTATAESGFNLTVGAGSSNGWTPFLGGTTPTLIIPPGGTVMFTNPQIAAWVVDSTHKTLKFDPGVNTLTALFGIIGE